MYQSSACVLPVGRRLGVHGVYGWKILRLHRYMPRCAMKCIDLARFLYSTKGDHRQGQRREKHSQRQREGVEEQACKAGLGGKRTETRFDRWAVAAGASAESVCSACTPGSYIGSPGTRRDQILARCMPYTVAACSFSALMNGGGLWSRATQSLPAVLGHF